MLIASDLGASCVDLGASCVDSKLSRSKLC